MYIFIYMCLYVYAYIMYMQICTYIYVYICTFVYIYIYVKDKYDINYSVRIPFLYDLRIDVTRKQARKQGVVVETEMG